MTRFRSTLITVLTVAIAATACGGKQDTPKVDLAGKAAADSAALVLSSAAKAALDSGNALFRGRKYDLALAQYQVAAKEAPAHAAPLFGIYMIGRATNNKAMADSAMAGIRARNAVPAHDTPDTTQLQELHAKSKRSPSAAS